LPGQVAILEGSLGRFGVDRRADGLQGGGHGLAVLFCATIDPPDQSLFA
jgi:hypothetical protein